MITRPEDPSKTGFLHGLVSLTQRSLARRNRTRCRRPAEIRHYCAMARPRMRICMDSRFAISRHCCVLHRNTSIKTAPHNTPMTCRHTTNNKGPRIAIPGPSVSVGACRRPDRPPVSHESGLLCNRCGRSDRGRERSNRRIGGTVGRTMRGIAVRTVSVSLPQQGAKASR